MARSRLRQAAPCTESRDTAIPDSECPPRVLREMPAACAANTVHLYRPACSRTMGNLPDDVARRLPTASYSAPSPRRRVGRGSVRAHRTRRRGRRPHEKMAIHVVTAGACGGWHPPSVRGGLTPRRSVIRQRGRQPCRFGNVRKRRVQVHDATPEHGGGAPFPRFPLIDDGLAAGANHGRELRLADAALPPKHSNLQIVVLGHARPGQRLPSVGAPHLSPKVASAELLGRRRSRAGPEAAKGGPGVERHRQSPRPAPPPAAF